MQTMRSSDLLAVREKHSAVAFPSKIRIDLDLSDLSVSLAVREHARRSGFDQEHCVTNNTTVVSVCDSKSAKYEMASLVSKRR